MMPETKSEKPKGPGGWMKIVEMLFSSTRFKVVLATIAGACYIVQLCIKTPDVSNGALWAAELGLCLITGLALAHIASRTFTKTNGDSETKAMLAARKHLDEV